MALLQIAEVLHLRTLRTTVVPPDYSFDMSISEVEAWFECCLRAAGRRVRFQAKDEDCAVIRGTTTHKTYEVYDKTSGDSICLIFLYAAVLRIYCAQVQRDLPKDHTYRYQLNTVRRTLDALLITSVDRRGYRIQIPIQMRESLTPFLLGTEEPPTRLEWEVCLFEADTIYDSIWCALRYLDAEIRFDMNLNAVYTDGVCGITSDAHALITLVANFLTRYRLRQTEITTEPV